MLACATMRKLAVVVIVAACGQGSEPAPSPVPKVKTPDEIGAELGNHLGAHDIDAAVAMFAPDLAKDLPAAKFQPEWDKSIDGAGKFIALVGTAATPIEDGTPVLVRYRFEPG